MILEFKKQKHYYELGRSYGAQCQLRIKHHQEITSTKLKNIITKLVKRIDFHESELKKEPVFPSN